MTPCALTYFTSIDGKRWISGTTDRIEDIVAKCRVEAGARADRLQTEQQWGIRYRLTSATTWAKGSSWTGTERPNRPTHPFSISQVWI